MTTFQTLKTHLESDYFREGCTQDLNPRLNCQKSFCEHRSCWTWSIGVGGGEASARASGRLCLCGFLHPNRKSTCPSRAKTSNVALSTVFGPQGCSTRQTALIWKQHNSRDKMEGDLWTEHCDASGCDGPEDICPLEEGKEQGWEHRCGSVRPITHCSVSTFPKFSPPASQCTTVWALGDVWCY